jgi:mRNA-degrading endonuclease toxin of MazEF toxin-antitoxin module
MFDAGTVVLMPFPFSAASAAKRRPVLMLTQPDHQCDFVGMPLTNQAQPAPALQLLPGPMALGGALPLTSWVKTDTVYSLSVTRIIKTIGRLGEDSRAYCVQQLCLYLNRGQ